MAEDFVSLSRQYEEVLGHGFPLVKAVGKKLIEPRWSTESRLEPDRWRQRLAGWSGNVAMPTGSGIAVVDADLYVDGGEDSLCRLRELGLTIYTPTTITGAGGRHLWYRADVPIVSRALDDFPGIDVKADGGAVIAVPSIHENGRPYEWEYGWSLWDCELARLPLEVLALLDGRHERGAPRVLDERDEEAVNLLVEHFDGHHPIQRDGYVEVTRPGKESGCSATVGYSSPGHTHVWSTHWPNLPADGYWLSSLRKRAGVPGPKFHVRDAIETMLVCATLLRSREQQWIWQDFLPRGHLVLGAGPEKLGKSTAFVWAAARATKGELPGSLEGKPINVALISGEDDAERVLKPRAVAAGADLDRLFFLNPKGGGFSLPALRGLDLGLVILDPISVFAEFKGANEHGEMAIRDALQPFALLAQEDDVTIAGVRHTGKRVSGNNPFDAVLGSRAWSAAPRGLVFFTRDPEHEDRAGGLLFSRGNLAQSIPACRYRLDSCRVALDDGTIGDVPVFVLEEGGVGIALEDVLGASERVNALGDAKEFLLETLADGAVPASEVQEKAKLEEIKPMTLRRAKTALGVVSERSGFGPGSVVYWRLSPIGDP
jgi:hypothetical protein